MIWPKTKEEARALLGKSLIAKRRVWLDWGRVESLPGTIYGFNRALHLLVFGEGYVGYYPSGEALEENGWEHTVIYPAGDKWVRLVPEDAPLFELSGVTAINSVQHKCSCAIRDLLMRGCKCGGV